MCPLDDDTCDVASLSIFHERREKKFLFSASFDGKVLWWWNLRMASIKEKVWASKGLELNEKAYKDKCKCRAGWENLFQRFFSFSFSSYKFKVLNSKLKSAYVFPLQLSKSSSPSNPSYLSASPFRWNFFFLLMDMSMMMVHHKKIPLGVMKCDNNKIT